MIHEQTNKLGVLLAKIKGPQLQKTQVAAVGFLCLWVCWKFGLGLLLGTT